MDKQQKIIVSAFKSAKDTTPQDINLLKWLEGNKKLKGLVDQIRKETDKDRRSELKKQLPAITPSGKFKTRKAEALINHSGFIALDFDNCDPQAAKKVLSNIVNVFYAGLSASGRGCWALIPINDPTNHRRHFDALKADFEALGLEIDQACKDVCRLRFFSYDPDPIFNLDAVPYRKLAKKPIYRRTLQTYRGNDDLDRLIQLIVTNGRDITTDYTDWLKIGSTLASIYGEGGRDKFHAISQFYHKYDPRETDRQFTACLRNRPGYGPGMLFSIAKRYGVVLSEKAQF